MNNDNKHKKIKTALRVTGFICLPVGIVLLLCGTIPFLRGYTAGFYLNFIGVPLIFVGVVCLTWGFMREMHKYVADENVPVATDAANKFISGTRDEISKTSSALRQEKRPVCSKCGTVNEVGANFCDNCGASLAVICPDCGEANDGDANFCRKCGKKL